MEQCAAHWFGNVDADGYLNTREFDGQALREGNYISTQSLVRRVALPSAQPFDVEFPALEDWELWLTMSAAGAKFYFCDIPLWNYRIHENNLSRNAQKNRIANELMRKKHGWDIGRARGVAAVQA